MMVLRLFGCLILGLNMKTGILSMTVVLKMMFGLKRQMECLILVSSFDVWFLLFLILCSLKYMYSYLGEVWPGPCVFPDYTQSKVRAWWANLVKDFISNGVDGIWNDMNEPSIAKVFLVTNYQAKMKTYLHIRKTFCLLFLNSSSCPGCYKNNAWEQCS